MKHIQTTTGPSGHHCTDWHALSLFQPPHMVSQRLQGLLIAIPIVILSYPIALLVYSLYRMISIRVILQPEPPQVCFRI
jgi:hypothetical protein